MMVTAPAQCFMGWLLVLTSSYSLQVIAAEGEHKASRALKDAAEVINESSSALQLRYLQTLTQISAEKNSTIIFPLPIDLCSHLMKSETKPWSFCIP